MRHVDTFATEREGPQERFCAQQPSGSMPFYLQGKRTNCSITLRVEREKTLQKRVARPTSSPQSTAVLQQRNQSLYSDLESTIGL